MVSGNRSGHGRNKFRNYYHYLISVIYPLETSIGVIGTPKVGKSSVISSILKCCGRTTAKNANLTKLNDNIKLATIPGLGCILT